MSHRIPSFSIISGLLNEKSLDLADRQVASTGHRRQRLRFSIKQTQDDSLVFEKLHGVAVRVIAERWFDVLVGATVHEIRSILTPLVATVARLLKFEGHSTRHDASVRAGLVKIKNRLAFLERLVFDMRDYTRPVSAERRAVQLAEIVDEAESLARENLQASGHDPAPVRLFVNVPDDILVWVARHQIVAAIRNVLKNAFEAFFRETRGLTAGEVHVRAAVTGDNVRIVVQDKGPGLAVDDLREVQSFVPGRTSKKNRGTGFGLPIARRYIISQGGKLGIESREGRGTKVTITLPLALEGKERSP